MTSRQGFRHFTCSECQFSARWPTRDCFSPSGEHCPECGELMYLHKSEVDKDLPIDNFGNLVRKSEK